MHARQQRIRRTAGWSSTAFEPLASFSPGAWRVRGATCVHPTFEGRIWATGKVVGIVGLNGSIETRWWTWLWIDLDAHVAHRP